jgi:class 3 adenylate cyclase
MGQLVRKEFTMNLMRRQLRLALLCVGALSAGATAAVPFVTYASPPPWLIWSLNIAAGLSLVVIGFLLSSRRPDSRIGPLLGLAGILFFAFALSWFRSPFLWTLSTLTVGVYLAVAAHVVILFPDGRFRSRFDRAVAVSIYVWAVATNFVLLALFDARDYGSGYVPRNLVLVYGDRGLRELLEPVVTVGNLIAGSVVVVIFARRWAAATALERRAFAPLAVALGVALGAFLVRAGGEVADVSDGVASALAYSEPAVWILLPIGFLIGVLRSQSGRAAVGELVIDIRESVDPERLRAAVARALGDPSLELAYWNPGVGLYVDADGRPIELPGSDSPRAATVIEGRERPLGALVHDGVLEQVEPKLLASVAAAVRLGLENQRLSEEVNLSRRLPASLVERLRRDGRRIGDTETLEVTVLMSDVRGYSTIAEQADPRSLAAQLNEHRQEMTHLISSQGGTVMQFVGDEVFAVFGAPVAIADHASRAVRSALEMQEAQAVINARWRESDRKVFGLGIGLSTGNVAGALLGSEQHTEYSVVGDTVNLAHRLQQWARAGEIVISSNTFEGAGKPAAAEPLEAKAVKGRKALVTAYRLRP